MTAHEARRVVPTPRYLATAQPAARVADLRSKPRMRSRYTVAALAASGTFGAVIAAMRADARETAAVHARARLASLFAPWDDELMQTGALTERKARFTADPFPLRHVADQVVAAPRRCPRCGRSSHASAPRPRPALARTRHPGRFTP